MKNILVICLVLLGFPCLSAQNNKDDTTVYIIDSVQVKPKFIGDIGRFLGSTVVYPEATKDSDVNGTIYISFIIERDGSISNIKSIRSQPGQGTLVIESIKAVAKMPKWNPAMKDGHPVRTIYYVPFRFVE